MLGHLAIAGAHARAVGSVARRARSPGPGVDCAVFSARFMAKRASPGAFLPRQGSRNVSFRRRGRRGRKSGRLRAGGFDASQGIFSHDLRRRGERACWRRSVYPRSEGDSARGRSHHRFVCRSVGCLQKDVVTITCITHAIACLPVRVPARPVVPTLGFVAHRHPRILVEGVAMLEVRVAFVDGLKARPACSAEGEHAQGRQPPPPRGGTQPRVLSRVATRNDVHAPAFHAHRSNGSGPFGATVRGTEQTEQGHGCLQDW